MSVSPSDTNLNIISNILESYFEVIRQQDLLHVGEAVEDDPTQPDASAELEHTRPADEGWTGGAKFQTIASWMNIMIT